MTVQIELWQLVGSLITLVVALAGLLYGFGKLMLAQNEKHQDERFALIREEISELRKLENRFTQLHLEMAERYVRREDYVRGQTVIEAKLDAVFTKQDLLQLHVAKLNNNRGQS